MNKLLFLVVVVITSTSARFNDTQRLYREVIDLYDHRIRPVISQNDTLFVEVTFSLLNLLTIREIEQAVSLNAWMNFTWIDQIRTWDPQDYDGTTVVHPDPLNIWRPRIQLSSSVEDRDVFKDDYAPLSLNSDGIVRWYPSNLFAVSCILDITFFPFDVQNCDVSLFGIDYAEGVRFVPANAHVNLRDYIHNGEWDILSSEVREIAPLKENNVERFSRVVVNMTFRRRPLFFLINILIPVLIISLLSSLVFVLPEGGGERASFSVTVLFSLTVFLGIVSEKLPQNSDKFPIIIIYLFVLLIHSCLCVVVNVAYLSWIHNKNQKEKKCLSTNYKAHDSKDCHLLDKIQNFNQSLTGSRDDLNNGDDLRDVARGDKGWGLNTISDDDNLKLNQQLQRLEATAFQHNRAVDNLDHMLLNATYNEQSKKKEQEHKNKGSNFKKGQKEPTGLKRLLYFIVRRMKNINVQMFVFFNVSWLIITGCFLLKLVNNV